MEHDMYLFLNFQCLMIILCTFGIPCMASQYSDDNITDVYKNESSSSKASCEVFVIETTLKGSDIGFATIAAVCIIAGFILVFAGTRFISLIYITISKILLCLYFILCS